MYDSKSDDTKYQSLLLEIVVIRLIKIYLSPNIPYLMTWNTLCNDAGMYLSGLLVDITFFKF